MQFNLGPEYTEIVRRDFDEFKGYGENLKISRSHFRRQDECGPNQLLEIGFEKLPVFSEADSAEMCEKMDDHLLQWSDKDEILSILETLFTPEIDKRIVSYFESEYLPTTVKFARTAVNYDDESGRWHCDSGPSKHLILMAYFTPSEPDYNAGTHFLDRATTDRMKEIGYAFCLPEHRVGSDDLAALAYHFDIEFKAHCFIIKPGDAIIFDAPNIMHRGAYPKLSPRYAMVVSLIPSPVDWRTSCQRTEFLYPTSLKDTYPSVDWSLV